MVTLVLSFQGMGLPPAKEKVLPMSPEWSATCLSGRTQMNFCGRRPTAILVQLIASFTTLHREPGRLDVVLAILRVLRKVPKPLKGKPLPGVLEAPPVQ